jgi:hypothetical protein
MKRWAILVIGAVVVVALISGVYLGIGLAFPRTISGEAKCPDGEPVVGVWVEALRKQHDGWANWQPDASQTDRATFEHRVPRWPFPYEVQVGCGGTPEEWATNNSSGMLFTGFHSLDCQARPGEYFGTCR